MGKRQQRERAEHRLEPVRDPTLPPRNRKPSPVGGTYQTGAPSKPRIIWLREPRPLMRECKVLVHGVTTDSPSSLIREWTLDAEL